MTVSFREACSIVRPKLEELYKNTLEEIKEQAREIDRAVSRVEVLNLRKKGAIAFLEKVDKEFQDEYLKKIADVSKQSFEIKIVGSRAFGDELGSILKISDL
ncbi:MAG: hypothetical protein KDK59_07000 [Simkania sp.]|nr:hypothetical protein [Simkania sp.]